MMKEKVKNLFPGDVFHFLGEDRVCRLLVKYADNRITIRDSSGNVREIHDGNLPVVVMSVRKKKREEKTKKQKPVFVSEVFNRKNPHIHRGLYITLVLLVCATIAIFAFSLFVGH